MAYSFAQLEQLWKQAGGSPASAPIAAAVALAESAGNPNALNNNPSTGDYSVGLWQINYFGSLYAGRTAQFGPPAQLTDPLTNAKAAVAVSSNGTNFHPWSTYNSGAYEQYLTGSSSSLTQAPPRPSGNPQLDLSVSGALGAVEGVAGGLPIIGGLIQGASTVADMAKVFVWLFSPKHWAMVGEAAVGVVMIAMGVKYLATDSSSSNVSFKDLAFWRDKSEPSNREYGKAYDHGRKQGKLAGARREGRRSTATIGSAARTVEPEVLFA